MSKERTFKVGDVITHTLFGSGTVTNVSDQSITVQFDKKYGKTEKILLLKYNLTKIK